MTRIIQSHVPAVFEPALQPARYKDLHGGRGAAKSHFYGERAVLRATAEPVRIVCIREVQKTLKQSVHQLLADKIRALGIGDRFDVLDAEIRGKNGSLIIFQGMQSHNAESIKSLEAYDVAWVEEAQTLSGKSLRLLRPTIRKEGSEIWFSRNRRHRTDPVDVLFRENPPPGSVSIMANWRDNPWFPAVLRREMEHDKATDPLQAEHVWEGAYGVSEGSILGRYVEAAEREGRINDDVDYDPDGPGIEISSDLGFRDTASWWFWQRRAKGTALLDYDGDSGLDAEEWIPRLQDRLADRGWPLAKIWLPHDAKTKTFQSRHSAIEQFLKGFGHAKVQIVPRTSKTDRINAARTVTKTSEFNAVNCAEGLEGLRAWEYKFNEETQVYSKDPDHTWASHPSDAYSYGCQVMTDFVPQPVEEGPQPIRGLSVSPYSPTPVTLDELWEQGEQERWKPEWI